MLRNTASIQHKLAHVVTPAGIFHIAWKTLTKQHCQSTNHPIHNFPLIHSHAIDQLIICWPIPTATIKIQDLKLQLLIPPQKKTSLQIKSFIRNSGPRAVCQWKASSLNTQPFGDIPGLLSVLCLSGGARLEMKGSFSHLAMYGSL